MYIHTQVRFFEWTLKPTGNTTAGSLFMPLLPHTVVDNVLVMAWIALFLFAALVLLNLPAGDLIMAGFRKGMYAYV